MLSNRLNQYILKYIIDQLNSLKTWIYMHKSKTTKIYKLIIERSTKKNYRMVQGDLEELLFLCLTNSLNGITNVCRLKEVKIFNKFVCFFFLASKNWTMLLCSKSVQYTQDDRFRKKNLVKWFSTLSGWLFVKIFFIHPYYL